MVQKHKHSNGILFIIQQFAIGFCNFYILHIFIHIQQHIEILYKHCNNFIAQLNPIERNIKRTGERELKQTISVQFTISMLYKLNVE